MSEPATRRFLELAQRLRDLLRPFNIIVTDEHKRQGLLLFQARLLDKERKQHYSRQMTVSVDEMEYSRHVDHLPIRWAQVILTEFLLSRHELLQIESVEAKP